MKGAIAYSLFGYNRTKHENSFSFETYIRGLLLNIRLNRLLYPNWGIVLQTDYSTFNAYCDLFGQLPIKVEVNEDNTPLTKAMLWRMKPVFNYNSYTHVICRDLDSPPTYREAQAVQDWINSDKAAHAITDSVSHTVPMMGGMIGFRPQYFPEYTGYQHWAEFFEGLTIDFTRKGADQDFLNRHIYPKFAQPNKPAILQHYVLGMPNTFLEGYKNYIPNIGIDNVSNELEESNELASHIGQAGFLMGQTFRLLQRYQHLFTDLLQIEKDFPNIAYWVNDNTFI